MRLEERIEIDYFNTSKVRYIAVRTIYKPKIGTGIKESKENVKVLIGLFFW
jgi:hypothetical protein